MEEKVALRVITKYLKKGNMARCLRDILPSSGLSKQQREEIAEIIHDVVRWKRLYEYIIDLQGLPPSAETYLRLAQEGAQADAASFPFEYRYSCSPYVASILKDHTEWAEFLNETPPTTLCVNFNRTTTDNVLSMLQRDSLSVERSLLPTAVFTTSVGKYSRAVEQHYAHVQDETSQLVAQLTVSAGESVFDYCAGNGGKSLAIASLGYNKKNLHAYEKNESKRAILRRRCEEYGANVVVEENLSKQHFDVVLVDAPCSGLGAARRNPEVKYIQGAGDLPQMQLSILTQAARSVRQGGVLLYAVCTVTPEETSRVIETFLSDDRYRLSGFAHHPYETYLLKERFGVFTTLPRGDLFFLSVLKKETEEKNKARKEGKKYEEET